MLEQIVINGLIAGSLYSLVALGFSFTFAPTKFFNLAYGAVVLMGGYLLYTFYILCHWPLWLSFLGSILSTSVLGYALDLLVFQPLRQQKASSMVFLVASLGAFTCLQSILAIFYGSHFRSLAERLTTRSFNILGSTFTNVQLVILCSVIAAATALHFFLKITKYGKAVKAMTSQPETARIVGINTDKILGLTFLIGSALAGVAGALLSMELGVEPSLAMGFLLKGAIASIIGGAGSIPGAVLGGFLLGFVENLGAWQFQGEWKEAVSFALLVVFLLLKPGGIFAPKESRKV